VAAGDDDIRTGQVDALENLVGRRCSGEAGSDGLLVLSHVTTLRATARILND
jgi:hypothetical protein